MMIATRYAWLLRRDRARGGGQHRLTGREPRRAAGPVRCDIQWFTEVHDGDPQERRCCQRSRTRCVAARLVAMYGLRDERGYGFHAGLHGLPLPTYCEHGTSLFLPWHRAYVYLFERALQDRDPAANLPWWDWSSARAHAEGIPLAFRAGRLGGAATGNPLGDGPVTLAASDLALVRANLPWCHYSRLQAPNRRDPDVPGELPRLATVRRALDQRTFGGFTALLVVRR